MINREKKCMLGSVAVHAALLAALLVGSAFVSSSAPQNPDDMAPLPTIQQIPSNLVDELIYNPGGAQEIGPVQTPAEAPKPAPAQEARPTPKPTPEKKAATPPKVETRKTTQAETPVKKTEPKKVNLDQLRTKVDPSKIAGESQSKAQAAAEAAAAAEAERQRKAWADVLSGAKATIQDSGSSGSSSASGGRGSASEAKITGASLGTGDGTGSGEAVANYAQAVRSYYRNAWISPATLKNDKLTTVVRVVINRNGSIHSATITTRSGDKDLDESVQKAIDSVVKLPPFPKGSTDSTRTYTIRFNLRGANIL